MNSNNLKNNPNVEREILSADEQKVCDLIGKLDRVDCPKNFDFRLKARIASADKSEYRPSVWQTLRYVVPVAACVLIVAFVMVRAGMFSPVNQMEGTIASSANPNIQPFDERSNQAKVTNTSVSNVPGIAVVPNKNINSVSNMEISNNSPEIKPPITKLPREDAPTMYRDFSVRPKRDSLFPSGINPEPPKLENSQNQGNKSISIKEALDFMGVQTDFSGGKMKVRNVRENTMADRSGIKTGDVIEAIDDTKIAPNETMLKSNSIRKIIISRGGRIMEILLSSQQF